MAVQNVGWNQDSTKLTGNYTFPARKCNTNRQLQTGYFVRKEVEIMSPVKTEGFFGDRLS
jgi:hypothetical protein